MGDVVEFPGLDERAWLAMEGGYRDGLKHLGMSIEQTEWILLEWKRRMRMAMSSLQVHIAVPHPPDVTQREREVAETVGNAVMNRWRELLGNVSGQLLIAMIDLYHAQPGNPPPSKQMNADILNFAPGRKPAERGDDEGQ